MGVAAADGEHARGEALATSVPHREPVYCLLELIRCVWGVGGWVVVGGIHNQYC